MGSRRVPIANPIRWKPLTDLSWCDVPFQRSDGGPTTHPLQRPKICLSCSGHQFEDPSLESLEVLCQKGHHRKECPGILYDYPLGKIPAEDWVANVVFFKSCFLLTTLSIGSRGSVYQENISVRHWIPFGPTSWSCQPG